MVYNENELILKLDNNLNFDELESIIYNNPELRKLSIEYNKINEECTIEKIKAIISNLKHLKTLIIINANLSRLDILELLKLSQYYSNLNYFDFSITRYSNGFYYDNSHLKFYQDISHDKTYFMNLVSEINKNKNLDTVILPLCYSFDPNFICNNNDHYNNELISDVQFNFPQFIYNYKWYKTNIEYEETFERCMGEIFYDAISAIQYTNINISR